MDVKMKAVCLCLIEYQIIVWFLLGIVEPLSLTCKYITYNLIEQSVYEAIPVNDWLLMLPPDINEMKRNDLWLNVKGIICSLLEKYF